MNTIADYIASAPPDAQPHLKRVYAILRKAAPQAQEAIKWNAPFFIEPRFVYSFSFTKRHVNFAPSKTALAHFAKELATHPTTQNYLQLPYDRPLPEDLLRRIAEYRVQEVKDSPGDAFW